MPKLVAAVSLKVSRHELAALRWVAKTDGLRRYDHRDPSAAAVLRLWSLNEAVKRYDEFRRLAKSAAT